MGIRGLENEHRIEPTSGCTCTCIVCDKLDLTCEVKTLAEKSIIEIGDEGSCQLVITGSNVLIELVSQDALTVSYCTDGVYAYGDVQSGKYIHLDAGRCGASEFIFVIASSGNSTIAYLSQTSTRGIINPLCSAFQAVLVFSIMPLGILIALFLSVGSCVEEGVMIAERMNETSWYRALVCCSGVLCLECCVRNLIDPSAFASCQDRFQSFLRSRFSSFQPARSGELPAAPQLEMEPV